MHTNIILTKDAHTHNPNYTENTKLKPRHTVRKQWAHSTPQTHTLEFYNL